MIYRVLIYIAGLLILAMESYRRLLFQWNYCKRGAFPVVGMQ